MMTSVLVRAAANGTDWTAVAAWAAWATAGIYIALGLFAWRQVREARKLREEQARPFVVVDFEPGFLVYLTVENLGRTMARDVRISFDKQLETSLQGRPEIDESPLFREPIPALPPGKKIRVLFDQFNDRLNAKLPLAYEVTLRYRGPAGKKPLEDTYRLDLGMYLGSQLPPKGLAELVTEAENIRKEIGKWKGDSDRGLLVNMVDKRRQDRMAMRRTNMLILRRRGRKALAEHIWDRILMRFGLR
jgi:hypothetical protein